MKILLTNDDGIESAGLRALVEAFDEAELTVVAPDSERSGYAHAFSFRKPVPFRAIEMPGVEKAYAVDGTPVDCVKLGLFMTEHKIDWVFSGINLGANLGIDAFYSGTVGAATEGAIQECHSVAFSLQTNQDVPADVKAAATICRQVFEQIAAQAPPTNVCISINVPARPVEEILGIFPSTQGRQRYVPEYEWEPSQNNHQMLFRRGGTVIADESQRADYARLRQGWVTVTPLSIDRTEHTLLEEMRKWTWTL